MSAPLQRVLSALALVGAVALLLADEEVYQGEQCGVRPRGVYRFSTDCDTGAKGVVLIGDERGGVSVELLEGTSQLTGRSDGARRCNDPVLSLELVPKPRQFADRRYVCRDPLGDERGDVSLDCERGDESCELSLDFVADSRKQYRRCATFDGLVGVYGYTSSCKGMLPGKLRFSIPAAPKVGPTVGDVQVVTGNVQVQLANLRRSTDDCKLGKGHGVVSSVELDFALPQLPGGASVVVRCTGEPDPKASAKLACSRQVDGIWQDSCDVVLTPQ